MSAVPIVDSLQTFRFTVLTAGTARGVPENRYDESKRPTEMIPPSEKFMAAVDLGMLISVFLIAFGVWRRGVARRKSPNGPVPDI